MRKKLADNIPSAKVVQAFSGWKGTSGWMLCETDKGERGED